ncbi:MLP-like protein 31 [Salvia hispanica]|uniref:MLP-like protein 31 n=1 Tax=Salvia hispanica TaxID=49212 RepID=UPI0020099A04|nr:MLP-like protein 31 [Salvia hispanica]
MASYPNKLIAQLAFKASGNVFHQLVCLNPRHFIKATPTHIQDCKLHQGEFGVNGSVIEWSYSVDGKPQTAKQVLQGIDKEKKQISWKMLEGDLCVLYKDLVITAHVETKNGVDFITWTIDYELISPENPHPVSFLNFFICLTKDLESHIFG